MANFATMSQLLNGLMACETETRICPAHGEYQVPQGSDYGCFRCENERNDREYQAQLEADAKAARLAVAGIPQRFHGVTMDDYRVTHGKRQERVLNICKRYHDRIEQTIASGNSLILHGTAGTGKTMLAAAIGLHAIECGFSVRYATAIKAAREIKKTFSGGSEQAAIDEFARVDLLILDEIGIQFGSDTEKNIFFEIINERYEERRPTIVISNLDSAGIAHFLGERVMSRLKQDGVELSFDWNDYRTGGGV